MRFIGFLVSSGGLIGVMLLVRKTLRGRIPPGIMYALWLIPAVRLLFPFVMFPVPVLPEALARALPETALMLQAEGEEEYRSDIAKDAQSTDERNGETLLEKNGEDEGEKPGRGTGWNERKIGLPESLLCFWLSGSIFCAGYVIQINRRLKRDIKRMKRMPGEGALPVYIQAGDSPPCLFGLFHPCILLCEAVAEDEELRRQTLLHEETHYRQKDHIWTVLRIFLCTVYWWNPLVWLGAVCARDDAEFACDARALRGAGLSEKKAYGYALLSIVQRSGKPRGFARGITSVSGRGKNMKRRLENIVAENRKTKLWTVPVCMLLIVFFSGFCFPVQRIRAQEGGEESGLAEEMRSTGEQEAEEEEREEERGKADTTEGEDPHGAQSGKENVREETGILLHPQEHREGYRETNLKYSAAAQWLTDLSDMPVKQERIEILAKRAIRELYDLTGYQAEECFYGYNEIGMLFFAKSEEDLTHSRIFYSYALGEKDGYEIISSIDIVNARRVWYSDVQQLALPENAGAMEREYLALWFLEHSPLCPEGLAVRIEPVPGGGSDCLRITMEDGTFYEVYMDMEILAVSNIYGPYPKGANH